MKNSTIDRTAEKSFNLGNIVGHKIRKIFKMSGMWLIVLISSIIISVLFFVWGFLHPKQ